MWGAMEEREGAMKFHHNSAEGSRRGIKNVRRGLFLSIDHLVDPSGSCCGVISFAYLFVLRRLGGYAYQAPLRLVGSQLSSGSL